WIYGGADPSSGTASLLEVARCLGELAKKGQRPKRTVVFASWDAEEFGIIGSTEWAEDLKAELQQKAIAYLNVDIAATGEKFYASTVPSLKPLLREVTQAVVDPLTHQTVYETWKQHQAKQVPQAGDLGSGSDHSPFIAHLGIPSVSMGFHGPYGVYHAMQDNFYWMAHFGDPTFQYQATIAQIWGIMALRLANADILPFDYELYAKELLIDLKALQNSNTDHTIATDNPERLRKLLTKWEDAARHLNGELVSLLQNQSLTETEAINRRLHQLEQTLTVKAGLPLRPWFKHLVYAPGLHSGYAAVVFPGIRDAMETNDETQERIQTDWLAEAFGRLIEGLEQIRSAVNPESLTTN
ncbi:MAG: M28 family peptidase, partial [Candidatus Poribacteria bacterium]|nr:M28 family peptidase [Candidatus Poribacteria bacterium]